MTNRSTKLTQKQETFCREYLIDLNGTQAAIRTGYSKHSAAAQACRLLSNKDVLNFIKKLTEKRNKKLSIDADYVLRQAVALHERCMQQIQPKTYRSQPLEDNDGNTVYEFDAANALKALELIGKHVSIGAFKERMEVSGDMLNAHFILSPVNEHQFPKFASAENEIE